MALRLLALALSLVPSMPTRPSFNKPTLHQHRRIERRIAPTVAFVASMESMQIQRVHRIVDEVRQVAFGYHSLTDGGNMRI